MKLQLTERSAWTGDLFRLLIEADTATFWGSDVYTQKFPASMPLRGESIEELQGAMDLLGVFNWRAVYRSEDVGSIVDDGGSWCIKLSVSGRMMSSRGFNAYPSYKSSDMTTLNEERYGLLREAVFTALNRSVPYGFTLKRQEAEQNAAGQPTTRPDSK